MSDKHVTPLKTYLLVGFALYVLTVVTVAVSFLHLGPFNLVVAIGIAAIKAGVVALFFMHLLYDNRLFATVFSISIVFVAVFIILTMFDTLTRDMVSEIKAKPINPAAKIYQKPAAETDSTNH